jgi:hypothetical protein
MGNDMKIRLISLFVICQIALAEEAKTDDIPKMDAETTRSADQALTLLDKAEAQRLAQQYISEHDLNWGSPTKVEEHGSFGYWVYYETPEGEMSRLGPRVISINRKDGSAGKMPRR